MNTLVIDVGGTGTKRIVADALGAPLNERLRFLTPQPAVPEAVLDVMKALVEQTEVPFGRVSVGFPGVVRRGIVETAPNLGTEAWHGFDLATALEELTGRPTRVLNDAELQGYGVIEGRGVELVLTLGTGFGAALYTDGRLVPNLELGHHPFEEGCTYEERTSDAERKRIGKAEWRRRVGRALETLSFVFNPEQIHVGGGNAKKLKPEQLPERVRLFANVAGMTGGVRMWMVD